MDTVLIYIAMAVGAFILLVCILNKKEKEKQKERENKPIEETKPTPPVEASEPVEVTPDPTPASQLPSDVVKFKFQKSEEVLGRFYRVNMYTTKSEAKFQAGSHGWSFRIMKGVSFRVGNSRGHMVRNEVRVKLGYGPVAVTTKHLYYACGDESTKRIPLDKIVSIKTTRSGVKVLKEGERAKPIEFVFANDADLDKFVSLTMNQ